MKRQVVASEFNNLLHDWTRSRPHPIVGNKEVRFLAGKQSKTPFPHFQLFCTNPKLVRPSYERYLSNKIYGTYDFLGCPVVLSFRPPGRRRSLRAAGMDGSDEEW